MRAPSVRQTIINAFEAGKVLTNGTANEITKSTEGGRTIRHLRQEGYPIAERTRPNKLRSGSIKEFYYTKETLAKIKEEKAAKGCIIKRIFN